MRAYSVEDLDIAPNWSGTITFKTAGQIWYFITKSSAILDMEGVKDIGRNWFLMSLTGFFLGLELHQHSSNVSASSALQNCCLGQR